MKTQISFTADPKLKAKAMKKAKEKGITLKSLLLFSMEAFVDGKINLGIIETEKDVEEIFFDSPSILKSAKKLNKLLG